MILSDKSIREAIESGRLGVDPFDPKLIQPSSIDVRLDNKFLVFRNTKRAFIDVKQPADDLMEMIDVGLDEPMFLHPHEFVLGSTVERVRIPNDIVGRLEGRSSLGRLGVVIHSSLPYEAPVLFLDEDGVLANRAIGELVRSRARGKVAGFDRDTLQVAFHPITNWFEELPDRIFEVRLGSGRTVHVTAGHNLFTLDADGNVVKTPTSALARGTRVAIPARVPDPSDTLPVLRVAERVPSQVRSDLVCLGPVVERALERAEDVRTLLQRRRQSPSYWLRSGRLPLSLLEDLFAPAAVPIGSGDRIGVAGSPTTLPAVMPIDTELAWLLGLYVAEAYRRRLQVTVANTNQRILDRSEAVLRKLGLPVYRSAGAVTSASTLLSALFEGLGMGIGARTKRLPAGALGWPQPLLQALFEGLIDGDGSVRPERECLWTTSEGLVADALLLAARLGRRAVTQVRPSRQPGHLPVHVVSFARNRHKVLTSVPVPSALLVDARRSVATLERLLDTYVTVVRAESDPLDRLARLVEGDLLWDRVIEVVDTGRFEPVYDLEVRSPYGRVENFVAGHGGVLVSNTAGFIDASFEGHVTLEISNLANLPIALYPGMRIGQISFSQMTTPAERPYGPARGSKYSGQLVPTASRLYLDFKQ